MERTVRTDDGVRLHTVLDARLDGHLDAGVGAADDAGSAPTLLLVSSLGTTTDAWDALVPFWRATHQVLRYDQRGHGGSDVPGGPSTLERLGRDALAVLDAHGVARADVCGLSLGGLVALWLAVEAPERVGRLVLADTALRVGSEAAWRERAAAVRAGGMDAVVELVLRRFFSPAFRASDDPWLARAEAGLRATSPEGYAACCEALATADLAGVAGRVVAPTLVLVGSADEATPPADASALCAAIPGARLAELAGAGHLASIEQPAPFARLVHEHLLGHAPAVPTTS